MHKAVCLKMKTTSSWVNPSVVQLHTIGLDAPSQLKAILFVATFLDPPRPQLLRLINPLFRVMSRLSPPNTLIRRLMLGADASPALVERFKCVLNSVSSFTIAERLESVVTLQPPTAALKVPTAYILALQKMKK